MAEIIGYKYNSENETDDNIGVYHDAQVLDISSMHPSMFMSDKAVRKVRRRMIWWDIRHFYHILLFKFYLRRKWRQWQNTAKGPW